MSLSTNWLYTIFGLPFPLMPSTSYMLFFTRSSSSFHNTCSNHLNQFHFTSDTVSIHTFSLNSALGILSFRDTPHIHHTVPFSSLSVPISHSSVHLCPISHFHTPLHSSHITYTLAFSFNGTSFLIKIPDKSLYFPQHTLYPRHRC